MKVNPENVIGSPEHFAKEARAAREEESPAYGRRDGLSDLEFADSIGISARRLYILLRTRMPDTKENRQRAAKFAAHFGRKPEEYLRERRKVGRRRAFVPFTFAAYITNPWPPDDSPAGRFRLCMAIRYWQDVALGLYPVPPADFDTEAELIKYAARVGLPLSPDTAEKVWARFQVWQLRRVCATLSRDTMEGDTIPSEAMRAMRALARPL